MQREESRDDHATGDDDDEPLLARTNGRFALFPIQHDDMWRMYKAAEASFWTAEEIDLAQDEVDYHERLTDNERHFLTHVLAFFANADAIVTENLASRFLREVTVPEARAFYGFQIAIEQIHNETYNLLIDTYVRDGAEKRRLFAAMDHIPCVRKKADWCLKWIDAPTASFAERLVAFAAVEGVQFSGAFCAIFWLKKRGLMPGLATQNQFVARDEGMHADFACLLYRHLRRKLPAARLHEIVGEAVRIEKEFVLDAIPVALIGMNAEAMGQYIEFCADRLLCELDAPPLYRATNPFDWMEMISLRGKENFFERRVSDYQIAAINAGKRDFTTGEDF